MESDQKNKLQLILDILADAQKLIFFEKNWSKNCTATSVGQQCPAWDIHADAWSIWGAIEKILVDRNQMPMLNEIILLLEGNITGSILNFDYHHSHEDVIQLFYFAMGDIAEKLGYNMYAPLLKPDSSSEDYPVMFIPKEFDEMNESEWATEKARQEARKAEDHEFIWWYDD